MLAAVLSNPMQGSQATPTTEYMAISGIQLHDHREFMCIY